MELRKRKEGIKVTKQYQYVHVVEHLMTLEELGFKENNYHDWVYTFLDNEVSTLTMVASRDYIYLKEYEHGISRDIVMLWDKNIGGTISKSYLTTLINLLKKGNVREKKGS